MVDETASPNGMASVAAKIERESRFTRVVVVICTVANLCVMFYIIHEMFTNLPIAFMGRYMESLPVVHKQWKTYDNLNSHAAAPAAATPATAAPAEAPAH